MKPTKRESKLALLLSECFNDNIDKINEFEDFIITSKKAENLDSVPLDLLDQVSINIIIFLSLSKSISLMKLLILDQKHQKIILN